MSSLRRQLALSTVVLASALSAMLLVQLTAAQAAIPAAPPSILSTEPDSLAMTLIDRLAASPTVSSLVPVASPSRAKLPRDLVALERKMRLLHVNSERVSLIALVRGPHLGGGGLFEIQRGKRSRHRHGGSGHRRRARKGGRASVLPPSQVIRTVPLFTVYAETSVSPRLAILRGRLLGAIPFQVRVIGEQSYVRAPQLASKDGGRPWVYTSPAERAEEQAKAKSRPSLVPQLGQSERPESGFGKVIKELASARSVVEVGRKRVDGQATTEFAAQLDAPRFLGSLHSSTAKSGRRQLTKSERRRLQRVKVTLDLYIAPDGLPVRTRFDMRRGRVSLEISLDVLATEIPVSVEPPPASETITKSELEKLQTHESSSSAEGPHLTKRERAQARRFDACVRRRLGRRHGRPRRRVSARIFRECERQARTHRSHRPPK